MAKLGTRVAVPRAVTGPAETGPAERIASGHALDPGQGRPDRGPPGAAGPVPVLPGDATAIQTQPMTRIPRARPGAVAAPRGVPATKHLPAARGPGDAVATALGATARVDGS